MRYGLSLQPRRRPPIRNHGSSAITGRTSTEITAMAADVDKVALRGALHRGDHGQQRMAGSRPRGRTDPFLRSPPR